jgi:Tfp pilus assembly protein PilW
MSRICWKRGGFTLTELFVAMLFVGILVAALYGFFRDQLFALLSQETKTATLEDARGGLYLMVRELRNAGSWANGTAPAENTQAIDDPNNDADAVCNRIYAATKTLVIVQMDLDRDGNCTDNSSTDLIETVKYELTSSTSTCSGSNIIERNDDCLVANVVTPLGTDKLFSYYDSSNTDLGDNPSALADIKRIKITFRVQETNPNPNVGGNISSTLSSSVVLRN